MQLWIIYMRITIISARIHQMDIWHHLMNAGMIMSKLFLVSVTEKLDHLNKAVGKFFVTHGNTSFQCGIDWIKILQLLYIQGWKVDTEPRIYVDRNVIRKSEICGTVILEIIDDDQVPFVIHNPVFPNTCSPVFKKLCVIIHRTVTWWCDFNYPVRRTDTALII